MTDMNADTDSVISHYRAEPESKVTYGGRHIKSFTFPDDYTIPTLTTILKKITVDEPPENISCQFHFERRGGEYILIASGKRQAVIEEFPVALMIPFAEPKYDASLPFRDLIVFHYRNHFSQTQMSIREVHIFEVNEKSATQFYNDFVEYGGNTVFRSIAQDRYEITQPNGNNSRSSCGQDLYGSERLLTLSGSSIQADDRFNTMPSVSHDRISTGSENTTLNRTYHPETFLKTFVLDQGYRFLNVDDGDAKRLEYEGSLYNTLMDRIQLLKVYLLEENEERYNSILRFNIVGVTKSATLKRLRKHAAAIDSGMNTAGNKTNDMIREILENIKFTLIVLTGLHRHLNPRDAKEAVKSVKKLILSCIKLFEEMKVNKHVYATTVKPKFPKKTIEFIRKVYPNDIWSRCKQFGSAWTTAREDYSQEDYYIPTFGGTFTVNRDNYRPYLFGAQVEP